MQYFSSQKILDLKSNLAARPFLRWVGGKKWLKSHIEVFLQQQFKAYHEVFLGSGAIFFSKLNWGNKVHLSDSNFELINCYSHVRDDVSTVIEILKSFRNNESDFYKVRSLTPEANSALSAARMIYLNKLAFNGIYRVNKMGVFNVPYGHRTKVDFVDENNLRAVSRKLATVVLESTDFENALQKVGENELVFLDPPYTVAHESNGFLEYNQKIFSLDDQYRLCKAIKRLEDVGAFYILMNAKHDNILNIYSELGRPFILSRHSHVGGIGAKRQDVNEYMFTNCKARCCVK